MRFRSRGHLVLRVEWLWVSTAPSEPQFLHYPCHAELKRPEDSSSGVQVWGSVPRIWPYLRLSVQEPPCLGVPAGVSTMASVCPLAAWVQMCPTALSGLQQATSARARLSTCTHVLADCMAPASQLLSLSTCLGQ